MPAGMLAIVIGSLAASSRRLAKDLIVCCQWSVLAGNEWLSFSLWFETRFESSARASGFKFLAQ